MGEFLPSEIARLVLGYLKDARCFASWQTFLTESRDLEMYRICQDGKTVSTNINGKSLVQILNNINLKSESINNKMITWQNNWKHPQTENLTPSKVPDWKIIQMTKKSESGCNENQSSFSTQKHLINESITLHMKEMDILALDSTLITGGLFEYIGSKRKMPLQLQFDKKKQMKTEFTTPEASTSFKTITDGFALFKSYNHTEPFEEDNFSKLCDDIILHIFNFLPKTVLVKCSAVCKRWRTLSYDESLWRTYDFRWELIKPGILGPLLKSGVTDLGLAMSQIMSPIFTHLELANNQRFSCLQYLDLSYATLTEESLAYLLSVCSILKKLSLERCLLNNDCCRFIAQNKDLTVLNMAHCKGLTPDGVYIIAENCSKLIEWNLAWTLLNDSCMEAFLPSLPSTIRRFDISRHESLNDKCLLTIMNRCPHLIELDISDCPSLTSVSVTKLIGKCIKLERLHTSSPYCFPTEYSLQNQRYVKKFEIFRTLKGPFLNLRQGLPDIKLNSVFYSTIAKFGSHWR